jgi:glycosyltransferase involved in cell wall biosynthesis
VNGETGFIVPQQDDQDLARAILTILGDEQRRSVMARAGRRRVELEFSFSRRMGLIEDLYEQILHLTPLQRSDGDISTYTAHPSSSFLDKNLG